MSEYIKLNCTHCDERRHYHGEGEQTQCKSCDKWFQVKNGRINYYKNSSIVEKLKDGPCTLKELGSNGWKVQMVRKIKRPKTTTSAKSRPSGRKRKAIAYLPGDERRAVTLFIKHNTEYVASCIKDNNNPLIENWDDRMYQLLIEQWHWCDFDVLGEQK